MMQRRCRRWVVLPLLWALVTLACGVAGNTPISGSTGKALAQVDLAGTALAAPVVMSPSGEVLVLTTAGLQEVSALTGDPERLAPNPPSPLLPVTKFSSGTPFLARAGMY